MIRIATYSDAWTIADIYNYYVINTAITCELECVTPYQMVQRIEQCEKIIPYLVYEEDEVVVGYAHVSPEFRERKACVHFVESSIYLKNGFGGKGIGFQLYSELLSRTVSKYSIILAGMDLSNFASIRLHEKCGFTKVLHCSESARKFGKWIDIGFWQKSFGSH
jgi:phosphinothricin acetyltransferase